MNNECTSQDYNVDILEIARKNGGLLLRCMDILRALTDKESYNFAEIVMPKFCEEIRDNFFNKVIMPTTSDEEYCPTDRGLDATTAMYSVSTGVILGTIAAAIVGVSITAIACYKIPHLHKSWRRVYTHISTCRGDTVEQGGHCRDVEEGGVIARNAAPLNYESDARESCYQGEAGNITLPILHGNNRPDTGESQPNSVTHKSYATVAFSKQQESVHCSA